MFGCIAQFILLPFRAFYWFVKIIWEIIELFSHLSHHSHHRWHRHKPHHSSRKQPQRVVRKPNTKKATTNQVTHTPVNQVEVLNEYAEILKESLPLARAKHLKKETRLDAYDVCLDITRNMLKVATGETAMKVLDLHDVIKVEYDELKITSS